MTNVTCGISLHLHGRYVFRPFQGGNLRLLYTSGYTRCWYMMPFQGLITFYRAGQMFEPSGCINKRTHAPVGGHRTGARIRNSKDDNTFMSPERALYISIG